MKGFILRNYFGSTVSGLQFQMVRSVGASPTRGPNRDTLKNRHPSRIKVPPTASISSAADERIQTMTLLAGEGARSEIHSGLLSLELEQAEAENGWLHDALIDAAALRVLNDRAAVQRLAQATAETEVEHTSIEALKQELQSVKGEYNAVAARLERAQQTNEEWQERVRTVAGEFEGRSAVWQSQLQQQAARWQKVTDKLRTRLGESESTTEELSQQQQATAVQLEKATAQLKTAGEEADSLRGKLNVREDEIVELREVGREVVRLRVEVSTKEEQLLASVHAHADAKAEAVTVARELDEARGHSAHIQGMLSGQQQSALAMSEQVRELQVQLSEGLKQQQVTSAAAAEATKRLRAGEESSALQTKRLAALEVDAESLRAKLAATSDELSTERQQRKVKARIRHLHTTTATPSPLSAPCLPASSL